MQPAWDTRVRGAPAIFTIAGACKNRGRGDAQAGAGISSTTHHARAASIKIPESLGQAAPTAEVVAALFSVQQTENDSGIRIEAGKDTILKAMSSNLPKWEDKGWIGVPNWEPLKALLATLRAREAPSEFTVVKDSPAKDEANRLARAAMAYQGIKELRAPVARKTTDENVLLTQEAVKLLYNKRPTAPSIWKSIRDRDISRQVRNFLWKTLHGAHRIGKFWLNIPEMGERANCQHCGDLETMDHILTKCTRPGQSEIWALAKEFWLKKHQNWPDISMGSILGAGLAAFKSEGKALPSMSRLYKILMTESMYLIWKIRCEVVIGGDGDPKSQSEIHNRWVSMLNECLEIDRNLTNRVRFGKQYSLAPALVLDTWRGTLLNKEKLPDKWLREPEVLVGIVPMRSHRTPSSPVGRRGRNR
ncbi:hypothetical protein C8R44DRAFT_831628 [Mycena epipterygia]|nr:hypothetical protein C8R44DRAFT_831628 [Mycena epipterygia]